MSNGPEFLCCVCLRVQFKDGMLLWEECICGKQTLKEIKETPESENTDFCACFAENMDEVKAKCITKAAKSALSSDTVFATEKDLFTSIGINQSIFEMAFRK